MVLFIVIGVVLSFMLPFIQESDRRAADERRLEVSRTIAADNYKSPNSQSYGSSIPRENHDDDKKQLVSPYFVIFSDLNLSLHDAFETISENKWNSFVAFVLFNVFGIL